MSPILWCLCNFANSQVPEPAVQEVEVVEIVEEKAPAKKSKKGKKPAQLKPEDVDLDTLFKEMGVERRVRGFVFHGQ